MNNRQRRTLDKLFETPTRADISRSDIESLFGATVSTRGGSLIRVMLADVRAVFHSPHPRPHTDKGTVERVRGFLEEAGVTP